MATVSDRVRHARLYHGWSQAELADYAGISQPAIHKIERGGSPSADTLAAIAEMTQFSVAFFEKGDLPDLPKGTLKFRKRATASVRDEEKVRAHVRHTIEALVDLEHRLRTSDAKARIPEVRLRPVDRSAIVDGDFIEDIAVEIREVLGVGPADPIPNLTRAVERAGVAVIGSSQEIAKHDGASYWPDYPTGRPIVCLSRGRPGDKARLSLAHEIGHLVLHQLRDDAEDPEGEAFLFAGALLLPKEVALAEVKTPVTLQELALVKARFGISIRALVRRTLDLGLISTARRISLEKQISARGWQRSEPVVVPVEEPRLVRDIVVAATGTDRPERLRSILGLPALAIRDAIT